MREHSPANARAILARMSNQSRIAELKAKLRASERVRGMEQRCIALRKEIERLGG